MSSLARGVFGIGLVGFLWTGTLHPPAAAPVAPSVVLHSADGTTTRLADYKGRVVLIDFWASWCAPCKASFPALDTLYKQEHPRGLEVFAVNVDERQKDADTFLRGREYTMPVFFDKSGEIPLAFGVKAMPSSFVIDRAGAIRFSHIGYSASVLESYRREIQTLLSEN
jgi:thiol-disulfide isomerase/thioredoxin